MLDSPTIILRYATLLRWHDNSIEILCTKTAYPTCIAYFCYDVCESFPENFHHLHICLHSLAEYNSSFLFNKQHPCDHLFCACLYICHWVIIWHVAAKVIYVKRNELLQSAHDLMQWVSADRIASGRSSQDTAFIKIKTIDKIQALYVIWYVCIYIYIWLIFSQGAKMCLVFMKFCALFSTPK